MVTEATTSSLFKKLSSVNPFSFFFFFSLFYHTDMHGAIIFTRVHNSFIMEVLE